MKNDKISSTLLAFSIGCAACAQVFPEYMSYWLLVAAATCVLIFSNYLWRNRKKVEKNFDEMAIVKKESFEDFEEDVNFVDWKELFSNSKTPVSSQEAVVSFEKGIRVQFANNAELSKLIQRDLAASGDLPWVRDIAQGRRELKGAHRKNGPRLLRDTLNSDLCF